MTIKEYVLHIFTLKFLAKGFINKILVEIFWCNETHCCGVTLALFYENHIEGTDMLKW